MWVGSILFVVTSSLKSSASYKDKYDNARRSILLKWRRIDKTRFSFMKDDVYGKDAESHDYKICTPFY